MKLVLDLLEDILSKFVFLISISKPSLQSLVLRPLYHLCTMLLATTRSYFFDWTNMYFLFQDIDYEGFRWFLDTFLEVSTPDELSR